MEALYESERKARIKGNSEEMFEAQMKILLASKSEIELLGNLKSIQNKRNQDHFCFKRLIKFVFAQLFDDSKNDKPCDKTNELPPLTNVFSIKLQEEVIAGKIYLEAERIWLANHLKFVYRDELNKGYEIISDVPVETFTNVGEKEKNKYLFELCQMGIILNYINDVEMNLRKVRKSELDAAEMVIYLTIEGMIFRGKGEYLKMSKKYLEINEMSSLKVRNTEGCFFSIISTRNEEKKGTLKKWAKVTKLDENLRKYALVFTENKIINNEDFTEIIKIKDDYSSENNFINFEGFDFNLNLKNSIIEFNLEIIKKYFSKISIPQASKILELTTEDLIEHITELVNEGILNAKINQITQMISFGAKNFNVGVGELFDKITHVDHLIKMEEIMKK